MSPNASLPFPAALSGMANRALKVSSWMVSRFNHYFPFLQGCSVFRIVMQPIFTYGLAWMNRQSQHESSKVLKIYPFSWYIQFLRVALGSKNPCWPARLSEARVQDQKLERISYVGLLLALWLDLFCKAVVRRFDIWMFEHLAFLHLC